MKKNDMNNALNEQELNAVSGGAGAQNLRFTAGQRVAMNDLTTKPGETPVYSTLVTKGQELDSEKMRQMFLNSTGAKDCGPISI